MVGLSLLFYCICIYNLVIFCTYKLIREIVHISQKINLSGKINIVFFVRIYIYPSLNITELVVIGQSAHTQTYSTQQP